MVFTRFLGRTDSLTHSIVDGQTRIQPAYASNTVLQPWRRHKKTSRKAIDKVQRRFTKRLCGLRDYSCSERLQKLNLQSLKLRRMHYDRTLTRPIVFGQTVLKCQEFFRLSGCSITGGHRFKLMKQQCLGHQRHFFTIRVVNILNFLPKDVANFTTLCSFNSVLFEIFNVQLVVHVLSRQQCFATLFNQSINRFITRHSTEARATVQIMLKQREMS